jgi:light-regulated signal transduction histidine kinase (bacteriophytochrome)
MIYEYLRRQISSALKGNLLLRERIQAERELKVQQDQLEAFSYSVSHDLRAPLRSITGFSNILLEDFAEDIPDEVQEYLYRIIKNSQQMDQLIQDLLLFSRSGRKELEKSETDCAALAREVFNDFREREPGRNLELNIAELPICSADPILLRQVFANLFENALKFTRNRQVARIQVGHFIQEGKDVFFIRDNGVGFDMKYADKIFGVFQRLHSVSEYEGTGVGLATVQRVIHRHGGQIWAESELGKGTTFYFTLS